MSAGLIEQPHGSDQEPRRFMVIWQEPRSRTFRRVGCLEAVEGRHYRFTYDAEAKVLPDFRPFVAFPNVEQAYVSDTLFPFFANRLMSPRRPDFDQYVSTLGLSLEEWTPLELLARSVGERATDTIQVVAEPTRDAPGRQTVVFPASGVRYLDGAGDRIGSLHRGQKLYIREDFENPHDPRALILDVRDQEPVGWIPSYLLDFVHKHREERSRLDVLVERANGVDTPWHLRLICRLHATLQPGPES